MPLPFTEAALEKKWAEIIRYHYASIPDSEVELEVALQDLKYYSFKGLVPYSIWKALPRHTQNEIQWNERSPWVTPAVFPFLLGALATYILYVYFGPILAGYSVFPILTGCTILAMYVQKYFLRLSLMEAPKETTHLVHAHRIRRLAKSAHQKGSLTEHQETQGGDITLVNKGRGDINLCESNFEE